MPLSNNFSKKAKDYENHAVTQRKSAQALVIDSIKILPKRKLKVADLGCGPGTISKFLIPQLENEYEITNCDLSTEMLKQARKNLPYSKRIIFENGSIPTSSRFDLIISNFALQWYENIEETLRICIQKLGIDGVLAVSLPVKGSFSTLEKSFESVGISEKFFKFPEAESIRDALSSCEIHSDELREETESFPGTKEFLKELHQIGANQLNQGISTAKLRKLIRYHDELFDGKIIVSYKILKIIVKRVSK